MKVLDRYIIRELIKPIFFACTALVFLVLVADLFDNLDEFLKHKLPPPVILKYYLALVPYSFTQIIPWASWLGTLFLLITFGFHNEIMAMKAAGLKINSIVRPVLFLGLLIGIFTFWVSDQLVPKTFRFASNLKEVYIEKKKMAESLKTLEGVTYRSRNGQIYYFGSFSLSTGEVKNMIGLWMDPKDKNTRKKVYARKGRWEQDHWAFEQITEHHMDSKGMILGEPKIIPKMIYDDINFTPHDVISASSDSAFLSYKELKDSIRQLKENGVFVRSERVDLQYRLASPWQALVMMLVSIPLLAKTTHRKLIAYNVLICVGIIFFYNVAGAVGVALGKAGKLIPFLGAWFSNIAFAAAGIMTIDKANH